MVHRVQIAVHCTLSSKNSTWNIFAQFTLRKISISLHLVSIIVVIHYTRLYLSNHLVCFKTSTNLLSDLSSNIIIRRDVRRSAGAHISLYSARWRHKLRLPNSHEDGFPYTKLNFFLFVTSRAFFRLLLHYRFHLFRHILWARYDLLCCRIAPESNVFARIIFVRLIF